MALKDPVPTGLSKLRTSSVDFLGRRQINDADLIRTSPYEVPILLMQFDHCPVHVALPRMLDHP